MLHKHSQDLMGERCTVWQKPSLTLVPSKKQICDILKICVVHGVHVVLWSINYISVFLKKDHVFVVLSFTQSGCIRLEA